MNVLGALSIAIADLLRDDPRRVVLGEDAASGGMLGLSKACADDPELAGRVLSLPLLPTTLAAHAGGLALAGLRPIVLLTGVGPLVDGLAGLREVAALSGRSAGERTAPVLFVAPSGPGLGSGGEATLGLEAALVRLAGLRVVAVGSAREAAACLTALAAFEHGEDPLVLLVPRSLLVTELDDHGAGDGTRRWDRAARVRVGAGPCVFTWGECVDVTLAACDAAEVDATVIDVACLQPLDHHALVEAARDAGKIAIVHSGPRSHGVGAELAALFADEAIYYLDAPLVRVCGADGPLSPVHEQQAIPSVERVSAALHALATH